MVNVGDEEGWASLLKSSVVKVVINFRAPQERQVKKFDTNPMLVSSYHHVYLGCLVVRTEDTYEEMSFLWQAGLAQPQTKRQRS